MAWKSTHEEFDETARAFFAVISARQGMLLPQGAWTKWRRPLAESAQHASGGSSQL